MNDLASTLLLEDIRKTLNQRLDEHLVSVKRDAGIDLETSLGFISESNLQAKLIRFKNSKSADSFINAAIKLKLPGIKVSQANDKNEVVVSSTNSDNLTAILSMASDLNGIMESKQLKENSLLSGKTKRFTTSVTIKQKEYPIEGYCKLVENTPYVCAWLSNRQDYEALNKCQRSTKFRKAVERKISEMYNVSLRRPILSEATLAADNIQFVADKRLLKPLQEERSMKVLQEESAFDIISTYNQHISTKLHFEDGSQATSSVSDAKTLLNLHESLDDRSKAKMIEEIGSSRSTYQKIVDFAKKV